MHPDRPSPLLGGLTPDGFMRRHWQRRPLLVRQAMPRVDPPVSRAELFALAGRDDVESRLVERRSAADEGGVGEWRLRRGPFSRRSLPATSRPGWTLLVQGLDTRLEAAREMLSEFRFVADARVDDLMLSYATDGGGVGPHLDSYDVFLLQVQGRRRWRIGRARDASLVEGAPLKLLARFEPEAEWLLEPGDLLYLPPRWAHDGVAEGECMTCSIGFRAPTLESLGRDLLARLVDAEADREASGAFGGAAEAERYADRPARDAVAAARHPARMPQAMQAFADRAVRRIVSRPGGIAVALGEALSEPKPQVTFAAGNALPPGCGVLLDPGTRMLYDASHVFVNGEAFRAGGTDARLLRRLADRRRMSTDDVAALSVEATVLVREWVECGWLHAALAASSDTFSS